MIRDDVHSVWMDPRTTDRPTNRPTGPAGPHTCGQVTSCCLPTTRQLLKRPQTAPLLFCHDRIRSILSRQLTEESRTAVDVRRHSRHRPSPLPPINSGSEQPQGPALRLKRHCKTRACIGLAIFVAVGILWSPAATTHTMTGTMTVVSSDLRHWHKPEWIRWLQRHYARGGGHSGGDAAGKLIETWQSRRRDRHAEGCPRVPLHVNKVPNATFYKVTVSHRGALSFWPTRWSRTAGESRSALV